MPARTQITVDASDLTGLIKGLNRCEEDLKKRSNGRLRDAAEKASGELLLELRAAASSSATPQARIVADSMRVKRDRLVAVTIGGRQRVGSRGTNAGAILWGSEHGGENFGAGAGGSYWIAPTVDRYLAGPAQRAYLEAVANVLRDARLI